MAYRKIQQAPKGNGRLVLAYSSEWQEYRIRFYIDAEAMPEWDYFTTDKQDALDTFESMTKNAWLEKITNE